MSSSSSSSESSEEKKKKKAWDFLTKASVVAQPENFHQDLVGLENVPKFGDKSHDVEKRVKNLRTLSSFGVFRTRKRTKRKAKRRRKRKRRTALVYFLQCFPLFPPLIWSCVFFFCGAFTAEDKKKEKKEKKDRMVDISRLKDTESQSHGIQ